MRLDLGTILRTSCLSFLFLFYSSQFASSSPLKRVSCDVLSWPNVSDAASDSRVLVVLAYDILLPGIFLDHPWGILRRFYGWQGGLLGWKIGFLSKFTFLFEIKKSATHAPKSSQCHKVTIIYWYFL